MQNFFSISPMSQRFSLEPGQTYEGKISIVNPVDSTEDFSYIVSVTPYSVVGADYSADLATATNHTQISNWITLKNNSGTISPNTVQDINFTITVPENAPAGGQYATIAVSNNPDKSSSSSVNINTVFEIASIIYADVAGETIHDGDILENNVPGFLTTTPIEISALLSNNGNVHEDATFVLSVKNNFTGEVIYPTENTNEAYTELVMPESTRLINREIANTPAIGVVHVSQTIYYNGQYSSVEKDVIICPIWLLALGAAIIGVIISTIVFKVFHRKKKQQTSSLFIDSKS